jgi:hypothetical protein
MLQPRGTHHDLVWLRCCKGSDELQEQTVEGDRVVYRQDSMNFIDGDTPHAGTNDTCDERHNPFPRYAAPQVGGTVPQGYKGRN